MFLIAPYVHDFTQLRSLFALPDRQNNPHDSIFEQVTPRGHLEHLRCLLLDLRVKLQVVDWVGPLALKIAILRDQNARRELLNPLLLRPHAALLALTRPVVLAMFFDERFEGLEIQDLHLDICGWFQVDVHLVFEEDGSIVDDRAGHEHIDEECVAFELRSDVYGTFFDEDDLIDRC